MTYRHPLELLKAAAAELGRDGHMIHERSDDNLLIAIAEFADVPPHRLDLSNLSYESRRAILAAYDSGLSDYMELRAGTQ